MSPKPGQWYDGKLQPTQPRQCVAVRASVAGGVLVTYRLPGDRWHRQCSLAAWAAWVAEGVTA